MKGFVKIGLIGMLGCAACSGPKFHVEGTVEGAGDDTSIILERTGLDGSWVVVDSTRLSTVGRFTFASEAPQAPEIYRLRMGDRYIYFPIDSLETISVATTKEGFGMEYSLEGSDNARTMEAFEKDFMAFMPNFENSDSVAAFKRKVYTTYLQDTKGSVVSYYILTKTKGRTPLFSPEEDYAYFSAVATAFGQYKPTDPRTKLLEQAAVEGRRLRNKAKGNQRVIEAEELGLIEINLPDESGKMQSLSGIAGKGKPILLVFSNMTQPGAGQFNLELRKFYESRGGNVNIYQVSLDESRHAWSDAASNLPWTTVYAGTGNEGNSVATAYNVDVIPTMFVIDGKGQLVDRIEDVSNFKL